MCKNDKKFQKEVSQMSDDKFSIAKGDELGEQDHNKVFTDKYIKP